MTAHVCVVIAVFRPVEEQLDELFASLAAQSRHPDTVLAVISDCISATTATTLAQKHGLPLVLAEPAETLDSVRAFEFGLTQGLIHCPPETYFALCDQDDIWHPDRLQKGITVLDTQPGTMLVHSDARVVDQQGQLIAPSLFKMERRLKSPRLRDLLYRNTVTGMTTLMRRSLVELALPFPRQSGVYFYHDLWLALLAAATGEIALIRQPLVDYRQHAGNVMGAVDRRRKVLRRRLPDASWLRREASSYGLARYLAHSVYARLSCTGTSFAKGKASQLRPYLARIRGLGAHLADSVRFLMTGNTGLARLAAGQAAVSAGRLTWGLKRSLTLGLSDSLQRFDDRLYSLAPGVQPEALHQNLSESEKASSYIDQRKEPRWTPAFTAKDPALCILVPSLNPSEIFAGIATAIDIGLDLAARGHRIRFIATDLPVSAAATSLAFLCRRISQEQATSGAAERITINCGVTAGTITHHRGDRFLATAWWSAFAAQKLIDRFGFTDRDFLYLIQDFEPNFYAWGSEFADAMASYDKRFTPIFNTTLLRDYFIAQGFSWARPDSLTFGPSIDIDRYARGPRPEGAGQKRRIALYGRPEVARNLFPTGIEVLTRLVQDLGLTPADVEIISVGLKHAPIDLANGVKINSLGKLPYEDYPNFLLNVDIGLSLMLSPHPSHPPVEMAASGVRVVTNSFANKDLSLLTPAILSAPPDADRLLEQMKRAWEMPPPTVEDRNINLSSLGPPMARMLDSLTKRFAMPGTTPRQRRVILHIGAPKCGSTFLQRALLANRAALESAGIRYPHSGTGHPGNAPSLPALDRDRILADLGDGHTLIYSHEDLLSAWRHGPAFKAACEAEGLTVQVVVFLRPFSQLLFGTYSQVLKQRFEEFLTARRAYDGRSFEEFAEQAHGRFRIDLFLQRWQAVFPDHPLLLAPHTAIQPTIEALLGGVGLDWSVDPHLTNRSLRVEDCDAIAAAMADPARSEEDLRKMLREAHGNIALEDKGRSPERIAMIETMFEESYRVLSEDFGYRTAEGLNPPHPQATAIAPEGEALPATQRAQPVIITAANGAGGR